MKKLILILAVLGLLTACSHKKEKTLAQGETINLLREVCTTQQVDHTLQIIDSLEQVGDMQPPVSDYWRGLVYDMGWRYRLAGYYYQRAFDAYNIPVKDWNGYAETGYRLACMKDNMQDYDKGLRIAIRLVKQADSLEQVGSKDFPRPIHAFLLSLISDFQIHLQQTDEAMHNRLRAYEVLTAESGSDPADRLIMCTANVELFIDMNDLDVAEKWLKRGVEVCNELEQQVNAGRDIARIVSEYRQHLSLLQAIILQARGKADEAAAAYASIPKDNLIRLPANLEVTVRYLMAAKRYDEAITLMNRIDTLSPASERPRMTFDIIRNRLVPRYEAFLKAGHNTEALTTATVICQAIDSAFTAQNRSDAAELSVIYETHQKDRALEQKEAAERLHLIIIIGLMLLLTISAIVLWRIIMVKRMLYEKNRELFDTILKAESEKQKVENGIATEYETPTQKLYCQIQELMRNKQPYTESELTRENLAQMLGTNTRYVADAIRECSDGMTVTDFLNHHRLSHAAHLLATTDDTVTLIADLSGFNNRSYFNRLFRERYKLTPSEFRKVAKEKL